MSSDRFSTTLLLTAVGMLQVGLATGQSGLTGSGQPYPNKSIRIVTTAPGGGNDFTARVLAQGMSTNLGQQVIVDNRTSSVVPGDIVAKAPPDGYVLLLGASTFYIGPLIDKAPYDAVRDFATITLATRSPNVVVVHPSVPVTSISELIMHLKSKPGELNYGTPGVGSSAHLAGELFKSMVGVNIMHIAYKGSGPASIDLLAGQMQVAFSNPASVTPHIKSGRLRALAVSSAQPSPLLPGLPTVAASGLAGYESGSIYGLWAPAKTPVAIINRLNQESVRILNLPDVKTKSLNVGMEPVGSTPEQLSITMKSEMARLGKLIKDAGIRSEQPK